MILVVIMTAVGISLLLFYILLLQKAVNVKTAIMADMRANLDDLLASMITLLEAFGAEYVPNEPGSGDVEYLLNGKRYTFNQFAWNFTEFYIDYIPVRATDFIKSITCTDIKQ